ncbi:MAG: tagaturonate reductase [Kiritimatiellae bacterium]|jgi:tagaturonate reductase|nr:tagaturonate reductase [Kiritimatiellia bacterium]
MEKLNRALFENNNFTLPQDVTIGSVAPLPVKAVQFGEGNFLRAFIDWMIDELNRSDMFNGSITVVQPIQHGLIDMLNDQDGIYTLFLRGIQNGEQIEQKRVITSINNGINPYKNWDSVLTLFKQPELRFMFSNTTEAGIAFAEEDFSKTETPNTFPAKAARLLFERWEAFNGADDKGLIIIPCELIDRNGDKLKQFILQYAKNWNLPDDFSNWIENSCQFLNTLVDRIVPGYPREDAGSICQELGYKDNLIDTGEIFHLWVIEGPKELAKELPFDKVGLNVIWTDDMTPYRTRKVRMLNGAHTSSVLGAYLGGVDTVGDMVKDDVFGPYLNKVLFNEVLPILDGDKENNREFAAGIMERFSNPYIRHELLSISLNSVSKWKVRVMPSFLEYVEKMNELPAAMTYSLAALIAFYRGKENNGTFEGSRETNSYTIKDSEDILEFFEDQWDAFDEEKDVTSLVAETLSNVDFWGQDLTLVDGFVNAVTANLISILTIGSRATVKNSILVDSK